MGDCQYLLEIAQQHFSVFVRLVNMVIERVYSSEQRLAQVGAALSENHSHSYVVLSKLDYLSYRHNEEVRAQCFARMYNNVLEQAARIILSDWTRRQLMASALRVLSTDEHAPLRLVSNRYVPPDLVRRTMRECVLLRDKGHGFYYSLSVLRQLRRAIDEQVLNARGEPLGSRGQQRRRVQQLLTDAATSDSTRRTVTRCVQTWALVGLPFTTPQMNSTSTVEDFSASTGNMPSQGYWYVRDHEPGRSDAQQLGEEEAQRRDGATGHPEEGEATLLPVGQGAQARHRDRKTGLITDCVAVRGTRRTHALHGGPEELPAYPRQTSAVVEPVVQPVGQGARHHPIHEAGAGPPARRRDMDCQSSRDLSQVPRLWRTGHSNVRPPVHTRGERRRVLLLPVMWYAHSR